MSSDLHARVIAALKTVIGQLLAERFDREDLLINLLHFPQRRVA